MTMRIEKDKTIDEIWPCMDIWGKGTPYVKGLKKWRVSPPWSPDEEADYNLIVNEEKGIVAIYKVNWSIFPVSMILVAVRNVSEIKEEPVTQEVKR